VDIPLFDLPAQHRAIRTELARAMDEVMTSGAFILGERVEAFEQTLAAYVGAAYAYGVASGTDALLLALRAAEVGTGADRADEVIVPAFTFFATAGAVWNAGARPVFCDIEPHTYTISAAQIEALVTPQTRAIVPVHLYGQPADMTPIRSIAGRHDLVVIEDAAQALGASYEERRVGTLGKAAAVSFFPTKPLGAAGDGGAVLTDDLVVADQVAMLRVHGARPKHHVHTVGTNSRLDVLQAAILRTKLPHLEAWTRARQRVAARYDEALADIEALSTPHVRPGSTHVYHLYVLRTARRDALAEHLRTSGIGCGIYYPEPLHTQPCFADLGYAEGDFPESEAACRETLAIPCYAELTEAHQKRVVDEIRRFYTQ